MGPSGVAARGALIVVWVIAVLSVSVFGVEYPYPPLPPTLNSPEFLFTPKVNGVNRIVSDAKRDKTAIDTHSVHLHGLFSLQDRLYTPRYIPFLRLLPPRVQCSADGVGTGGGDVLCDVVLLCSGMGVHPFTKSIVFTLNQTLPARHSTLHPSNTPTAANPTPNAVDPYSTFAIRVEAHMIGVQPHTHSQGRATPHTINLVLYHRSSLANPLICDDGLESCGLYGHLAASTEPYELVLIHSEAAEVVELEVSIEPLWQSRALIKAQSCSSLRNAKGELAATSLPLEQPIVLSTIADAKTRTAVNYSLDTTFEDGFNIHWDWKAHAKAAAADATRPSASPISGAALFSSAHTATAANAATSRYTTASFSTPYRVVASVPIKLAVAPNHGLVHGNDRIGYWELRSALSYQFLIGGLFQFVLRSVDIDPSKSDGTGSSATLGMCSALTTDAPCINGYASHAVSFRTGALNGLYV